MNIGIYNPYLDSLSGGERYTLTLASHWSTTHDVSVFWDDATIIRQATERFFLPLDRVRVVPNIFKNSLVKKLLATKPYDVLFVLSDGSVPMSLARYNILHFQVPFTKISANPVSLSKYQSIVCNSEFTKMHIDKRVSTNAIVIYPPVSVTRIKPVKKQKCILSVGRIHEVKKHTVLIDAFRSGVDHGYFSDWKLVIAGGLQDSDRAYYHMLTKKIETYPIEIIPNIAHAALQNLYTISTCYWHAAGYGESNPQNMEHFGITTVEAMAHGCIPLVYNAGGQPEIVRDTIDGFVWNTVDDLVTKTKHMVTDPSKQNSMSLAAVKRSAKYSEEVFCRAYDALLTHIAG